MPTDEEVLLSPTSSTQTPLSLSASTPRKKKFINRVKQLEKENKALKRKIEVLEAEARNKNAVTLDAYQSATKKMCPMPEVASFINTQVSQIHKKPRGRRYSKDFKISCLEMYFTSSKLYKKKLMKKYCLPSPQTLLSLVKEIRPSVGLTNDKLFHILRMKVANFREEDKLCTLCVDEMSIKTNLFYNKMSDLVVGFEDHGNGTRVFKPAGFATVLMARGIFSNWKQPFSYFLFNSGCPGVLLKNIVEEAIVKLRSVGLKVVALISDMGSNNLQMVKKFDISDDSPFFNVNDQKVVYLPDTPHIVKAIRNMLLKYNFVFEGKIISWEYIKMFYESDKTYKTRAAPKLTDCHINPTNFNKMKVKYAAQVFSASVVAGMSLYIRFGALPAEAVTTAEFVERIDKLFDLLNSSRTSGTKIYNRAFKGLEYQVNFLKDCIRFFEKIQVVSKDGENITKRVKCIKYIRITISGILHLWDMVRNLNYEYILTRRLNQDCLENYFGFVRQQNGNCVNPTAIQFQRSFKKSLCLNLFNSGTENCEGDSDNLLIKVSDMIATSTAFSVREPAVQKNPLAIDTDYQNNDILEQNVLRYVCGYLIKKCLNIHACDICNSYAKAHGELDDTSIFCHLRAYENRDLDIFGNLQMPHDNFVYFISSLEVLFDKYFEKYITSHFIEEMYNICKHNNFKHPCTNFPIEYVIKLYLRMKLYYTLKRINMNFKTSNKNKLIIWRHK